MSELIVGIDLGTTNSAIAVASGGKVQVIPIHGQPTMPSCVGIDPSGKLIVGTAARNQLIAAPESTVLSIKRKMGEDSRVALAGKEFSPEEISSFILRELKVGAEQHLGQTVSKAVITVPAFFNERQRKATQVAGELAGLDVVRIINEPTAAALAYGAGRTADEIMLVYDLGGGTFDVSLVVVEQGIVEVKASHGDTHLGGDDFDQLLIDHAVREFQRQHGVDLSQDLKALRRLKVVLERAKCRLSDEPFTPVREEFLDGAHHLDIEISRDEYEVMIAAWIEKTLTCLHQTLSDAKLLPKQIHKVMLVGGSTRTPLVHRVLQQRMQLDPRFEIDPDLIVAMGAAIQGAIIAGDRTYSILVDITPHTFSTSSFSGADGDRLICVPIIPRNTPLPAAKSELFYTLVDEQDAVRVTVYQGEAMLPEANTLVGEFTVSGLSLVPAGNPILLRFELDLNGLLKVTATEKATGLSKTVALDTRGKHLLDIKKARSNIASLLGPEPVAALSASTGSGPSQPSAAPRHDLLATARDLRQRAESLLAAASINPEDAQEIRQLVHRSAEAVTNRDWPALEAASETLSDLVFYLED